MGICNTRGSQWEQFKGAQCRETRVLLSPPPLLFFLELPWIVHEPSRIRNEFLYPPSLPEKWDFLVGLIVVDRSRNGSTPSLWMRTCRVDPLIIKKYYFCIIDAAGQMSISGVEEERKREKIVFRSASSCRIHPWETRRVDRFLRIDRTIELDSYR